MEVARMSVMRLRTAGGKLKVKHRIINGLRPVIELFLTSNPEIRSVIPGVIKPVRSARGGVQIRITVPTSNGWKAIAVSSGARQELFISTALSRQELEERVKRVCAAAG